MSADGLRENLFVIPVERGQVVRNRGSYSSNPEELSGIHDTRPLPAVGNVSRVVGFKWRVLPKRFGRWHTIYVCVNRRDNKGDRGARCTKTGGQRQPPQAVRIILPP